MKPPERGLPSNGIVGRKVLRLLASSDHGAVSVAKPMHVQQLQTTSRGSLTYEHAGVLSYVVRLWTADIVGFDRLFKVALQSLFGLQYVSTLLACYLNGIT